MGEVVRLARLRRRRAALITMGQKPRPTPDPLPPVDKPLEPIPQPSGDPIRGDREGSGPNDAA
jgi:hypothetical protein